MCKETYIFGQKYVWHDEELKILPDIQTTVWNIASGDQRAI